MDPNTVNVHDAKTHLSRLLERVEQGEEITIMRSNVPVAKLSAVTAVRVRSLGWAKGEFTVPDDINAPLPKEVEESFYK